MGDLKVIKNLLIVALIYLFGAPGSSLAQELPICTHQYYDADGDGFGWQNEASCLITSSSEPPPNFTNKSTGEPVTLVRPYWDGNTDIANRTIRCDRYDYQPANGDYQRPTDALSLNNTLSDVILTHQSISTQRKYTPFVGNDQQQEYYGWYILDTDGIQSSTSQSLPTYGQPLWRTNDGLYESAELLQAPYIEIINPLGVKAIRIWFNEGDRINTGYDFLNPIHITEGYFQCYDESGADFGPTGQIGTPGATPEPALQDLVLSGQSNDWYESDEVVNLATGERVALSKAYWNYNDDMAGKLIQCDEYGYDPVCNSAGYGIGCGFAQVDAYYYMMPWHLTDSTSNHGANLHWWSRFLGSRNSRKFGYSDGSIAQSIDRNRIPIFLRTDLVELLDDDKVRVWQEATDIGHAKYHECSVFPTGTADGSNPGQANNNETEGNTTIDSSENTTDEVSSEGGSGASAEDDGIVVDEAESGGGVAAGPTLAFLFLLLMRRYSRRRNVNK